jgi:hypothetical protein
VQLSAEDLSDHVIRQVEKILIRHRALGGIAIRTHGASLACSTEPGLNDYW